jgi:hypothetical protein
VPAVATYDDPEAYIAGDRRRALRAGLDLPDRESGAVLFADISAPLTEVPSGGKGNDTAVSNAGDTVTAVP